MNDIDSALNYNKLVTRSVEEMSTSLLHSVMSRHPERNAYWYYREEFMLDNDMLGVLAVSGYPVLSCQHWAETIPFDEMRAQFDRARHEEGRPVAWHDSFCCKCSSLVNVEWIKEPTIAAAIRKHVRYRDRSR